MCIKGAQLIKKATVRHTGLCCVVSTLSAGLTVDVVTLSVSGLDMVEFSGIRERASFVICMITFTEHVVLLFKHSGWFTGAALFLLTRLQAPWNTPLFRLVLHVHLVFTAHSAHWCSRRHETGTDDSTDGAERVTLPRETFQVYSLFIYQGQCTSTNINELIFIHSSWIGYKKVVPNCFNKYY